MLSANSELSAAIHYGTAAEVRIQRARILDDAYAANPLRFRRRRPVPPKLPTIAWINDPGAEVVAQST